MEGQNRSIPIPSLGAIIRGSLMAAATVLVIMLGVTMWGQFTTARSPVNILPWPNIEGVAPICLVVVKADGKEFLDFWCSEQAFSISQQTVATNPPAQ